MALGNATHCPLVTYTEHKHIKSPDKPCSEETHPDLLEYGSVCVGVLTYTLVCACLLVSSNSVCEHSLRGILIYVHQT